MSNIKHRDLGRILCYDLFEKGVKQCETLMVFRPVAGEMRYTIDLRLCYKDPDGNEFFYTIDKQQITATSADIEAKCDRLYGMLLRNDVFRNHVRSFMAEVKGE